MHFVLELAYFREAVKGEVSVVVVRSVDVVIDEDEPGVIAAAFTNWFAPVAAIAFGFWVVVA